jgi:hypothetical protein
MTTARRISLWVVVLMIRVDQVCVGEKRVGGKIKCWKKFHIEIFFFYPVHRRERLGVTGVALLGH